MEILICIDDTDNLESKGTGELAQNLTTVVEERGWGTCSGITRHQLLVHPDVPYTSHNSSMCFKADIDLPKLKELIEFASAFLAEESAEGSDPGLCVVDLAQVKQVQSLIDFGRRAKIEVLTKQEAYQLAAEQGAHLSEHGGTGQGVIGALAGVGLRLTGNDGRFKGKVKIKAENDLITVQEIIRQTKIDLVRSLDGTVLSDEEVVILGDKVKSVLLDNKCVLLVYSDSSDSGEAVWKTCTKQQLRVY